MIVSLQLQKVNNQIYKYYQSIIFSFINLLYALKSLLQRERNNLSFIQFSKHLKFSG